MCHSDDDLAARLYRDGRELMSAGQLGQAIELFRQSAELSPHFKTLELLGECLLECQRHREAIVPLAAATALNEQGRAPYLLARVFVELGELSHALRAVRTSLQRQPHSKRAQESEELIVERLTDK